jgi:phosphohistidine swiveling domain-containing protein
VRWKDSKKGSRVKFLSKAETLNELKINHLQFSIPDFIFFSYQNWVKNPSFFLSRIKALKNPSQVWAVRSSSVFEDNHNYSNAGAYQSLLNVSSENLFDSINQVFDSMEMNNENQVMVQVMVCNVYYSGVAFSHDPNLNSPYRVINWEFGNNTTSVTSGIGGRVWRQAATNPYKPPKEIIPVIELVENLLVIFEQVPLDIEFACTRSGEFVKIWLLQVRCLVTSGEIESIENQGERLKQIEARIARGMCEHPYVKGGKTLFGVMPDWNPAEIIGLRPKPLTLSLYRELITDSIWAYQRNNYGYRNLRSFPLMVNFYGLPYIDLRLSFNSFIPVNLSDKIAEKLANFYIKKISDYPEFHDKVEFEIVFSNFSFDLNERLNSLKSEGFDDQEILDIKESLVKLTNSIVNKESGLWKKDFEKIKLLRIRKNLVDESKLDPLEKMYWILEDTKRYGTLPFAGLARVGFISMQILKSLLTIGVLDTQDFNNFMGSLNTITSNLIRDKSSLSKEDFLQKYGHLRPGTYDIMSHRYDEKPEIYFDWSEKNLTSSVKTKFKLTKRQLDKIDFLLKSNGIETNSNDLINFIRNGIEMRELAKFEFTKNLSFLLSSIEKLGFSLDFSREDMSFSDVRVIKDLYLNTLDIKEALKLNITAGKSKFKDTLRTSLPSLISDPKDIWGYELSSIHPNYITQKIITAEITEDLNQPNLSGKIVLIPGADPGFDWIFSKPISGMITAWGGVNSHMAIRANELGIPAVIGVGDANYQKLTSAKRVNLDCQSQTIEIIL